MEIDSTSLKEELKRSPDWPAALKASEILLGAGRKCYLAGGSVRDALLRQTPSDFDVVTDASEEELKRLFPKSYTVGKSFGVLVVPIQGVTLEIAQFRAEEGYSDGRRPDRWQRATPEEDAQRRDFTVNALFYDMGSGQVLDYVGGLEDLKLQRLKCVGDPKLRLAEDKLRLFRAVRFAAQLGFKIEENTEKALRAAAGEVFLVSPERRSEELMKLLRTQRPYLGVQWMGELNWLRAWNLNLEAYTQGTLIDPIYGGGLKENGYKFLEALGKMSSKGPSASRDLESRVLEGLSHKTKDVPDEFYLLALLLAPWRAVAENQRADWAESVGRTLKITHKFSSEVAKNVREGLELLEVFYDLRSEDRAFWEKASRSVAGVLVHELIGLEQKTLNASKPPHQKHLEGYHFKVRDLPEMWVKGKDLSALGLVPSPKWGAALQEAYMRQLNGEFESPEEALIWTQNQLR